MSNRQCIIIGAGSVGLQLIRLLSRDLALTCIDRREERLAAAVEAGGNGLTTLAGDATSRLFLEEAGVDEAEMIVITTTSERVNLEIARILHDHFRPRRLLALGITPQGIETLEALGAEVVGIFALAAIALRNRIEQTTKAVLGVGLEKNEILEVEVHPHSRLANKALSALNPTSWRVGIIYREGNILIPTGDTVLRPKDRVILLGDPKVLKTVTDLLTFRFTHFPREFGDTLVAWVGGRDPERCLDEIWYLLSVFPLDKALFVLARDLPEMEETIRETAGRRHLKEIEIVRETGASAVESLQTLLPERGRRTSLIVLPRAAALPPPLPPMVGRGAKNSLRELARLVGCPILVAAGSFPYEKVAVPCVIRDGLQHAMETTLEMSSAVNYQIEAIFVRLSRYIATEEEIGDFEAMRKTVSALGLVYKTDIHLRELEGNPVKAVVAALAGSNLMVQDLAAWRNDGPFASLVRPDAPWEILRRAPVSCLLIPPMEIIV